MQRRNDKQGRQQQLRRRLYHPLLMVGFKTDIMAWIGYYFASKRSDPLFEAKPIGYQLRDKDRNRGSTMKKLLCFGLLAMGVSFQATSDSAIAGNWCRRDSYPTPPPQTYFRHEYPRYTAPVAGVVEMVPGTGPANYANTPVPYFYTGGFAPGGFVPNYEYSGGTGGYRLNVLHPTFRQMAGITVKPTTGHSLAPFRNEISLLPSREKGRR